MGYSESLKAAGAKVFDYWETGDYQGTWYALVEYNGKKGIVEGSYGSCSGCDSFLGEFDFGGGEPTDKGDGTYYSASYDDIDKEEYDRQLADYNKRLTDFGVSYLHKIQQEDILKIRLEEISKKVGEDGWSFEIEEKEGIEKALQLLSQHT